jgi:competence protein ComFC
MAKQSFSKFAKAFSYDTKVASVGIDDHVRNGYSHTAILNKAMKAPNIVPYYGRLRAGEAYKYAGKSLDERLNHPRKFIYSHFNETEVILVDDIVTTGTTLSEAAETLHAQGKKVLFCLTLTDAENK